MTPLWRHMSLYWKTTHTIYQIGRQGVKSLNSQTFTWIGENLEMQTCLFKNSNFPSVLWIGKYWKYTQPQTNIMLTRECVRLKIKIYILVAAKRLWGHSKSVHPNLLNFDPLHPCSYLLILHAGCLWIFKWKVGDGKERK